MRHRSPVPFSLCMCMHARTYLDMHAHTCAIAAPSPSRSASYAAMKHPASGTLCTRERFPLLLCLRRLISGAEVDLRCRKVDLRLISGAHASGLLLAEHAPLLEHLEAHLGAPEINRRSNGDLRPSSCRARSTARASRGSSRPVGTSRAPRRQPCRE